MRPFNLQYKGPLHSMQSDKADRKKEVHDIRRAFHDQLKRPWKSTELLRFKSQHDYHGFPYRGQRYQSGDGRWLPLDLDWAVTKRTKAGRDINFIPLVIRATGMALTCELEMRIAWREKTQGGIVRATAEGFDLDNRLKHILDALAIPQDNQLPDDVAADPSPYFLTLLEDDGLITRIDVKAHPIGLPKQPTELDAYLEIDIDVTVQSDALDDF